MVTVQPNSTSVGNIRIRTAANNSAARVVLHAGAEEAFSDEQVLILQTTGRKGVRNPIPAWLHEESSVVSVNFALRNFASVLTSITPPTTPNHPQVGTSETITAAAEKFA